jgi:TetR/AcrR family transcriptional regulator, cholesterol catabolism regulator
MAIGLRERKKQRQREAIVEASVHLFRERGFDGTRIQDILERAEISLGTFYNYFSGKHAVLDEFGANVIASYVELARHELEAADQPVAEGVRALARACGRAFSSDPAFMTVVAMRSRAFAGGGELPAKQPPIYTLLAQLFKEGQASGEIRPDTPPLELGEIFSGVFMYTVMSWLAVWQSAGQISGDEEAELEGRLMRAFDVFLDGCRTHGSRVADDARSGG